MPKVKVTGFRPNAKAAKILHYMEKGGYPSGQSRNSLINECIIHRYGDLVEVLEHADGLIELAEDTHFRRGYEEGRADEREGKDRYNGE